MSLFRPGDFIILVLAAALVGASYARFWGPRTSGETALISIGLDIHEEVALTEDRRLTVKGHLGDSVIQIRDGQIRFIDSPCPGRYCVHMGWIDRTGEVAACLPNGVVIEVRGGVREFDAINL